MKEIKRTSSITVEIDGDVYVKSAILEQKEPKPEWPTVVTTHHAVLEGQLRFGPINRPDTSKAIAILKCITTARAINGDWVPDWEDETQTKYCPEIPCVGEIDVTYFRHFISRNESFVWFHSEEACRHFIDHFSYIWLEAIG